MHGHLPGDPVYKTIDATARIFLKHAFAGSDVRDRVRSNLAAYFRVTEPDATPNPLVGFGFHIKEAEGNAVGEIAWSDLFSVICDTHVGRKMGNARLDVTLDGLPAEVKLNVRDFPVLGTVTVRTGCTEELALMALLDPSLDDEGGGARRGWALDAHGGDAPRGARGVRRGPRGSVVSAAEYLGGTCAGRRSQDVPAGGDRSRTTTEVLRRCADSWVARGLFAGGVGRPTRAGGSANPASHPATA
ncbi:MAG: hypothetical protein MUF54_13235 [Polyangiaceae bacterium]|nr:hypothetical protein [Polyangiaceae bacterium]